MERVTYGKAFAASNTWLAMESLCASRRRERKLPNKFVLIALPLNIKGGDASPARVVALVE
jgi:kynurenine formamidase